MHDSVLAFVKRCVEKYPLDGAIVEIGSLDVNGSVRDLIPSTSYIGIDFQAGPGVDVVVSTEDVDFYLQHLNEFDVAISTEALEHDPRPWYTLRGVNLALKMGAHFIVTARGFGPDMGSLEQTRIYGPHDYPHDYWRFSEDGMTLLLLDSGFEIMESGPDTDPSAPGVFIVARKVAE